MRIAELIDGRDMVVTLLGDRYANGESWQRLQLARPKVQPGRLCVRSGI